MHAWAYVQLCTCVECKAEMEGVLVQIAELRNAPATCSRCVFRDAKTVAVGRCSSAKNADGPAVRITLLAAISPRSGMKVIGPLNQPRLAQ